MNVVAGRAVVLDYGIKRADGSWRLASGTAIVNAQGQEIAAPTRADLLAQAHPLGQEWRVEALGFNPLANLPVEQIGVNLVNGRVVDYTVEVSDRDGSFYVWARNLDRALQLQDKTGDAREFNLRNFEIDFAHLDEVGSTDDSVFRVELLTPAQFHFATSLGGIDFRPEILTATIDAVTGHIAYSVNGTRAALTTQSGQTSDINNVIGLLQRARARDAGGIARGGGIEHGRRVAASNDNEGAWPERPFHRRVV